MVYFFIWLLCVPRAPQILISWWESRTVRPSTSWRQTPSRSLCRSFTGNEVIVDSSFVEIGSIRRIRTYLTWQGNNIEWS